jgi:hypothetical protein
VIREGLNRLPITGLWLSAGNRGWGRVEGLAGTVGEADGRLRQRLALDGAGEAHGNVIDKPAARAAPRRAAKVAPA